MDGFQLARLHRGTTWLVRAVAYGKEKCGLRKSAGFFVMFARNVNDCQGREIANADPTQLVGRGVSCLADGGVAWKAETDSRE